MRRLNEKYVPLVCAALNVIRAEMDRLYWNKYQQEMNAPFDNTGEEYVNDTFKVRAYYWGENENMLSLPNFECSGMEVFWYKPSNRSVVVYVSEDFNIDNLADILNNCLQSLRKDFGEIED